MQVICRMLMQLKVVFVRVLCQDRHRWETFSLPFNRFLSTSVIRYSRDVVRFLQCGEALPLFGKFSPGNLPQFEVLPENLLHFGKFSPENLPQFEVLPENSLRFGKFSPENLPQFEVLPENLL